ncbi:MAG: metallopeptidase family protein [Elusimicrobia bacterium]|nr:metallopeptidase family protein [Elusimicrobiota bacterium]
MTLEQFEMIVEDSLKNIPKKFKRIIQKEGINVLVREQVPAAVKERFPNKDVFGIFVGFPFGKGRVFSIQNEPTRIEIYKESFDKNIDNETEMKKQISKTVIHELAHYFGFNESEIRTKGY